MAEIEVIGVGAMNVDHLYRVGEVVVDGEQLVADFMSLPGGSAANTVYGLAKLGIKTGFVGVVGADEEGEKLVEDLSSVGVDASQIRIKQGLITGSTICFSDKLGNRAIYVSPGANNLLNSEDIDLSYLNQAQMVHLSSFADDKQFSLQVNVAKGLTKSAKVSLAPGMLYAAKGLKTLAPLLEKTQVVFINRDEIESLTGRDFKAGAQRCLELGCQVVVVTLGRGMTKGKGRTTTGYIRDGAREYEIESGTDSSESQLETTGAGDAFVAGFLLGLIRGKKIEECGLLGDIMSSFAIREIGARIGLPNLAQLSQAYLKRSGNQL